MEYATGWVTKKVTSHQIGYRVVYHSVTIMVETRWLQSPNFGFLMVPLATFSPETGPSPWTDGPRQEMFLSPWFSLGSCWEYSWCTPSWQPSHSKAFRVQGLWRSRPKLCTYCITHGPSKHRWDNHQLQMADEWSHNRWNMVDGVWERFWRNDTGWQQNRAGGHKFSLCGDTRWNRYSNESGAQMDLREGGFRLLPTKGRSQSDPNCRRG